MSKNYWKYNINTNIGVGVILYSGDAPPLDIIKSNLLPNINILETTDLGVVKNPNNYYLFNNIITQKKLLTFLVNKPTFIANDIDSCVITAQNLTEPVNILIDRQPYIISPTDNIITITSNEPKIFLIEPDPQSIYYFDKIEVEAT